MPWLGGFDALKLKTQLKLSVKRIQLVKNQKYVETVQQKKHIAALLETNKIEKARILVRTLCLHCQK
jgi:hypothetical protein